MTEPLVGLTAVLLIGMAAQWLAWRLRRATMGWA